MKLRQLADSNVRFRYGDLGPERELVRDMQQRLAAFGLLDPPSDGVFGPVSQWALESFMGAANIADRGYVGSSVARALLERNPETLFPLTPIGGLAGRVVDALLSKRHWICRHPDALNIVYVESMDPNGTANDNTPNRFNDARLLLRIGASGRPSVKAAWEATTEPGRFWTENPMDRRGAARIAFGQYKSWGIGMHRGDHRALVQTAPVLVHRDLNRDFSRDGDATFNGIYGINQHWGYDNPRDNLGRSSAGCLVGRTRQGHREFMALVETDPRYIANNRYQFMSAILHVDML